MQVPSRCSQDNLSTRKKNRGRGISIVGRVEERGGSVVGYVVPFLMYLLGSVAMEGKNNWVVVSIFCLNGFRFPCVVTLLYIIVKQIRPYLHCII